MAATVYRYNGDNGVNINGLYTFLTEDIATDTKRTTGTFLENATIQISGSGTPSDPNTLRIGRLIPESETMEYFYMRFADSINSNTSVNIAYISTDDAGGIPSETTGKRVLRYNNTARSGGRVGLNRFALFKNGIMFTVAFLASNNTWCYRVNVILSEGSDGRFLICFPNDDLGSLSSTDVMDDNYLRYWHYYTLGTNSHELNITPWRNDSYTTLLPIKMLSSDLSSFISSEYIFHACTCEFDSFNIHLPPLVELNGEEYVTNGFIYVKAT